MPNLKFLILVFLFFNTGCSGYFFYPSKQLAISPKQLGMPFEEIQISDINEPTLYGWFLPAAKQKGIVLFLHGNAENISIHLRSVYWLPQYGYSVFLFDYRGYGKSEGRAEIEGIHHDVERELRYVKKRIVDRDTPFFLFGQSLGATLALYTASKAEWRGVFNAVIAEAAFSSYRKIVREKLASTWITYLFQYPLSFTVTDYFSPLNIVDKIAPTPVLFIHGDRDAIVPVHHSIDLFHDAAEPKQLWIVPGGGHISALHELTYRKRLVEFLKRK